MRCELCEHCGECGLDFQITIDDIAPNGAERSKLQCAEQLQAALFSGDITEVPHWLHGRLSRLIVDWRVEGGAS